MSQEVSFQSDPVSRNNNDCEVFLHHGHHLLSCASTGTESLPGCCVCRSGPPLSVPERPPVAGRRGGGSSHGQQLFPRVQTWPACRGQPRGRIQLLAARPALAHGAEGGGGADQDPGRLRGRGRTVRPAEDVARGR